MKQIEQQAPVCNSEVPSREYLLAALRCGRTRLNLLALEIDEIGVLLSGKIITQQDAIDWIYNIGALPFVSPSTAVAEIPPSSIAPSQTTGFPQKSSLTCGVNS